MNINVQVNPVNAPAPNVSFELGDNGSAHVSINLAVGAVALLKHEDTYQGSVTRVVAVAKGTHVCTLLIAAYKAGALGPVYDAKVVINGQTVATTRGSIPGGQNMEYAYAQFNLVVA